MKQQHLQLRVDPIDGRIHAVEARRGKPLRKIKDITDEIMLCLCADLSADNVSKEIVRSIRFSDGMECRIVVEMVTPPNMEKRNQEVLAGNENGKENDSNSN